MRAAEVKVGTFVTPRRPLVKLSSELKAGTLAPLYTGFMRPDMAAGVGLLKVNRPEALDDMREAFAVTYAPYSNDWY